MALGTPAWGNVAVGNGATSINVPYPSGISAGDLLVIHAYCYANQSGAFTAPTDWSTHKAATASANGSFAVYYKVATGSETGSVSMTANINDNTQICRMYRVSGAGSSPTFVAGTTDTSENASPYVNSGVTPTVNGALVWLMGGTKDCITNNETDGFATWSGGTNLGSWTGVSNGSTSGSDAGMGSGYAVQSTAAATGNIQVTLQASQSTYDGISYSYAIHPDTVVEATARFAGTATLEKTTTARFAGTATLEKTTTARFAGTANLEKTATVRLAGIADLEKTVTARFAGISDLEKTVTARLAGTAELQVPSTIETARLAGTATLEKTATDRFAGTASLEKTTEARFAGLATLSAEATARLAGTALLAAQGDGRFAGIATLEKTATARLAGTATLETIATARLAGLATLALDGTGRLAGIAELERVALVEDVGRFAGTAFLRVTPSYSSAAVRRADADEAALQRGSDASLASRGGSGDAGSKAR